MVSNLCHGTCDAARGCVFALALLVLSGCASPPRKVISTRSPQEVRSQLVELLPASLADREGWAGDFQAAFQLLKVSPSTENLCAALAVTEQETGFKVDPAVPNLAKIARTEIEQRASSFKIPKALVAGALKVSSTDGRSYATRIAAVRTERDMSELFEEFIGRVPLGARLFADINPVRTGGPMQVSIDFSERHAKAHGYSYGKDLSIRHEVFSRRGGLYFGIAHLLAYPTSYERHIYRYADFNAGWYASRNAAFQAAVSVASGVPLALDGDLFLAGSKFGTPPVGATEAATRSLGSTLGISDSGIRRALETSVELAFEDTDLYASVFALGEARGGKPLARAVIPRITLKSPKITRTLTTEWFANRVQERYQRCVNRSFARG